MRQLPTPSRSEKPGWCVPWSTRAIIMLALAINLVPAGERFAARQQDPTEQLMLREGGFMAAWFIAPGAVEQVVPDVWLDSIVVDQSLVVHACAADSVVHWAHPILRLGFVVMPQGPPVRA